MEGDLKSHLAIELGSLKDAPHKVERTESTKNWRLEGMQVDYHPGLGLMLVERSISVNSFNIFLDEMTSDETYYDRSKCQNYDREFVCKVMTDRAREHNPKMYFRGQENVYGKVQLDLQGDPGLEFVDVLPHAMEEAPGEKFIMFIYMHKIYTVIYFICF